ncbi:MAG: alpha/beta hydrolase [Bacteroidetes bacterium]|nr:alpha/beta hydrolase [Bacteroidota bacterium]
MKKGLFIFLSLVCLSIHAQQTVPALPKPFPFGVIHQLWSAELNEMRTLNIYVPEEYYFDSLKSFPVIFLLDGSAHEDYPHIAGLTQFMSMYELMSPSIIVGIANVDRKRDFTFPTTIKKDKEAIPTSGGSAKFISFIGKELQPYMKSKFRVNTGKTIIGQSLGGLLATEILLTSPELFDTYIIVSPSLWWDNQSLLKKARTYLLAKDYHSKRIYVSVGHEHRIMRRDARALKRILKHHATGASVSFDYLPHETHATILHRSVYHALELLRR